MAQPSKITPKPVDAWIVPYSQESALKQWCQRTGWHGILDAYLAKSALVRISWYMVIVCSVVLTLNQCTSLIQEYLYDDQWITSITYATPEDGADGGLDWPNITVGQKEIFMMSMLDRIRTTDPYRIAHMKDHNVEALEFYDETQAPEPLGNRTRLEEIVREIDRSSAANIGNQTWQYVSPNAQMSFSSATSGTQAVCFSNIHFCRVPANETSIPTFRI